MNTKYINAMMVIKAREAFMALEEIYHVYGNTPDNIELSGYIDKSQAEINKIIKKLSEGGKQ